MSARIRRVKIEIEIEVTDPLHGDPTALVIAANSVALSMRDEVIDAFMRRACGVVRDSVTAKATLIKNDGAS